MLLQNRTTRLAAAREMPVSTVPTTHESHTVRGARTPRRTAKIDVSRLNFYYGAHRVLENINLAIQSQPGDGAHRAVGLRQVDASSARSTG